MTIPTVLVAAGKGGAVTASGRYARVEVHTDEFVIEGSLHLGAKAGGYKGRVSDVLDEETGFITLIEASVQKRASGEHVEEPDYYDTLILRKGEITFAIPFD